ncbi:MAG: signal peptidase II [Xanthobacteraceae bacterium]|nr:signal peptidase II [Xanthobacteraceae bacterium]PWB59388.1 MAG: signal peptidase II [Bradyrhizobiaceae bacterium]
MTADPAPRAAARLGLVTALLIVAADQASKLWLLYVYELGRRGVVTILPVLDLVLTWNYGISYGLFQQEGAGRWVLIGIAVVAVVLLGLWLRRAETRLTALALGLIIGGAVGNAIDRLAYGAVADFVLFHVTTESFRFSWYVFNLADAAIVAGVVGLLYESFFVTGAPKAP